MSISVALAAAIIAISQVPTLGGLDGGLIFSPLPAILGFGKSQAASASLFLNRIAAAAAAYTQCRKNSTAALKAKASALFAVSFCSPCAST